MRKSIIALLLTIILTLTQTVFGQSYHIGDLVTNADGSQGIVFYVNPDGSGGWMVALTDASTRCNWGVDLDLSGLENHTNQSDLLITDLNGYDNTRVLRAISTTTSHPVAWTVDFDNGWYIPSSGQLIHLNAVLGLLDDKFSQYGGQTLDGYYWSSSEYDASTVWGLNANVNESNNNGAISPDYSKNTTTIACHVRAIHDFSCREITYDTTLHYVWNTGETNPCYIVSPTQTTTYSVTATSTFGCTSSAQQTIIVQQDSFQTIFDTICQGESYRKNNFQISAEETAIPEDFTFTKDLSFGVCNTDITLNLHITAVDSTFIDTIICEGSVLRINENTYREAGVYYQTFSSRSGCDSILVIRVSVHPAITISHSSITGCPNIRSAYLKATFDHLGSTNSIEWSFNGISAIHTDVQGQDSCQFRIPIYCNTALPYTITVSDSACSITDTNYINLIDTIKPVITGTLDTLSVEGCSRRDAPAPSISVEQLESMGISVYDNCTAKNNLQVVPSDAMSGSCPITIQRTYQVTDNCGNFEKISQIIIIQHPDSILVSDVPSACHIHCVDQISTDSIVLPNVTDFCGTRLTDPTGPFIDDSLFNGCSGDITYSWYYTDCAEHQNRWTFTFHIEPEDFTIDTPDSRNQISCLSQLEVPTPPFVLSACGDTLSPDGPDIDSTTFNGCEGNLIYQWTYSDCFGHQHIWTSTFTIEQNGIPTLLLTGIDSSAFIECLSDAIEPEQRPQAIASCGDTLQGFLKNVNLIFDGCHGERTFTYLYTDCANNTSLWHFTYHIEDTTRPSFTAPENHTVHRDLNNYYDVSTDVTGWPTNLTDNCTPTERLSISYRDLTTTQHIVSTDTILREWILMDSCGNERHEVQHIFIIPVNHNLIDSTLCEEFLPLRWNGLSIFQNLDTTITLTDAQGVDSILTLQFRVKHGSFLTSNASACEIHRWHDSIYTQSGIFTFDYTNENGCASTDTLLLSIHHNTSSSDSTNLCRSTLPQIQFGHIIPYNAHSELSFTDTLRTSFGCDSIVTHYFFIKENPRIIATHIPDLCSGIGQEFYLSATENATIVLNPGSANLESVIVNGAWAESSSGHSFTITPPTTITADRTERYALTISNMDGCELDTSILVNLWAPRETHIYDTLCAGGEYHDHGFDISSTHNFSDTLLSRTERSAHNCDSTIIVHLNIRPSISIFTEARSLCPTCDSATLRVQFDNDGQNCQVTWTYNHSSMLHENIHDPVDSWSIRNIPNLCNSSSIYSVTVSNRFCSTTDSNFIYHSDTTAPIITGILDSLSIIGCPTTNIPEGPQSMNEIELSGLSISDNCTSHDDIRFSYSDSIVSSCPTTIIRTYTFSDACGNQSTTAQHIVIHRPDTIIFTSEPITQKVIECIDDIRSGEIQLPTATDFCGGNIILTEGPIISNTANGCEDTVTYTWTYFDCEGHQRDWTFTYVVERTSDPVIFDSNISDSAFVECSELAIEPVIKPLASSSCGDTISGFLANISEHFVGCRGTRIYTYQYMDCAGNMTFWHFTYTIEDTTDPAFTPPTTFNVHRDINNLFDANPTITGWPEDLADNCSPTNLLTTSFTDIDTTDNITSKDTLWREWHVSDSCGNTTSITQRIYIHPVNHLISDSSLCEESLPLIWNGIHFQQDADTTITLINSEGVDSILTLQFRVLHGTFQHRDENACESFLWHDSLYQHTGSYLYPYFNDHGCLSTDTLHLTIRHSTATSDTNYICRNDLPQNRFNHNIPIGSDSEVIFTDTLRTIFHCDSIVTRHFIIIDNPTIRIEDNQIDCSDQWVSLSVSSDLDNLIWSTGERLPNVTVPSPGTYSVQTTDEYGCSAQDSISLTRQEHPVFSLNIPDICSGETQTFSISTNASSAIVLHSNVSTLAVNDTIFLPDGTDCEPYGCSYRSPVTFTDFSPNARINSAEDIYYLRLNIEHSFCKDIYINLTCPNGQKADILKFGGFPTAYCAYAIPESSKGWSTGSNTSGASDFGIPNTTTNSSLFKCSSTLNPPGTGWNYCWSNNTNQHYTYASGAGSLIYRLVNTHGNHLDSSDVANRTHFYHPDQSFNSLIGCPMNGDWYIEVMDGYSVDNGYIFGWELALAPELHPENIFSLSSFDIEGPWVTSHSSSSFSITPPSTLTNDTIVSYYIILHDSTGCSFDTTINVQVWASRDTLLEASICAGSTFHEYGFTYPTNESSADTLLTRITRTIHGCDSTISVMLTILPTYHHYDTISIPEIRLPYTYRGTNIPAGIRGTFNFDTHYNSFFECDSLITTTAFILSNDTTRLDSTVCSNELPFVWYGVSFTKDSCATLSYPMASGADSIIYLNVHVIPNPIISVNVAGTLCAGDTLSVSFGYQDNNNIVLQQPSSTHQETQTIFLPDGMSCEPYGTYYRSYANFSDFTEGSQIMNADDIRYLRLKMEHSAIEDLTIKLVCPNGQSCTIIPDDISNNPDYLSHDYFRVNLGLANRQIDFLSCNDTLNPIGVPWNYIWSNNTSMGYQYAGGPHGYCFESANIHLRNNPYWDNSNRLGLQSYVIDSSNVANMSHIYHPWQSFNTLVGCPLNGDWYIQIQDLLPEDNGYLVEWEMALSPELLRQTQPPISTVSLQGPWVERRSEDTYFVTPPENLTHDTIITYIVTVEDTVGCVFDTVFDIHFYPNHVTDAFDTIVQNNLPYNYHVLHFPSSTPEDTTAILHLSTAHGCDSTVIYHLHVFPNDTVTVSNTLCLNALPYTWNGKVFLAAGTQVATLLNTHQADSVVIMTVNVLQNDTTHLDTIVCEDMFPLEWGPFTFNGPGLQIERLLNANGCDSIVFYTLQVFALSPVTNINIEVAENNLPYLYQDSSFQTDATDVLFHLNDANGCDSVINFTIHVHRNNSHEEDTTLCDYELPYIWQGLSLLAEDTYTVTYTDIHGADSILTLDLHIIETDLEIISATPDFCEYNTALLEAVTTLTDYEWSTGETDKTITVNAPGTYSVTATQEHCKAEAHFVVGTCDYDIFLPNAITPGKADGLNDKFSIPDAYYSQISDDKFSIVIVDRWGEVVFFSQDKQFHWDGEVRGRLYVNVIYNYVIRYHTLEGDEKIIKGSITVL